MIIGYLDIICIPFEAKAYAPLVIDGDRVLSLSVARKGVQAIARRNLQVIERGGEIDVFQPTQGPLQYVRRQFFRLAAYVKLLRVSVRKSLYHGHHCNASRDGCQQYFMTYPIRA